MKYQVKPDQSKESRTFSHLFIYKTIQRQYFLWMTVVTICSAFALSFVVHQTVRGALREQMGHPGQMSMADVLMKVETNLLVQIFLLLLLIAVIASVTSVFFLHRIVGPVYRIQEVLRKIADGQVPEKDIKLRTGDFFSELAVEINRALARLRAKR